MKTLFAFFAIGLMSFAVTATTGLNPFASVAGVGISTLVSTGTTGLAFSGLNKEIWLNEIKEDFTGDDVWVGELRDMSAFVDNDIINLAEAGVNPDVLINNTSYPISTSERSDGSIALELDRFDTENTAIKHADQVELSYDKRSSVVYGHKQQLKMAFMQKGAHAIAPAANTSVTPLLTTTGAADTSGTYKKMTFSDIRRMRTAFNEMEAPAEGRILLLSSEHEGELEDEDLKLYNQMLDKGVIYGFKVYNQASSRLPYYNTSTDVKVAFGAVNPAGAQVASVFFQKDEVMRANSGDQMFFGKAENDPTNRQDVIGFARRGLILPIRGKAVGAIYKTTVA